MHVVLLGDSILDNKLHVQPGEPDVQAQIKVLLSAADRATLLAVDGSSTHDVIAQLARLPADATHLIVSMGGNDILGFMALMGDSVRTVADALMRIGALAGTFEQDYRRALDTVLRYNLPATLCTIYNPRYSDPKQRQMVMTGLTVFNDVIIRAAFKAGVPLIDLRMVCDDDADFANALEPSAHGGAKIARSIVNVVREHDFNVPKTVLYC